MGIRDHFWAAIEAELSNQKDVILDAMFELEDFKLGVVVELEALSPAYGNAESFDRAEVEKALTELITEDAEKAMSILSALADAVELQQEQDAAQTPAS